MITLAHLSASFNDRNQFTILMITFFYSVTSNAGSAKVNAMNTIVLEIAIILFYQACLTPLTIMTIFNVYFDFNMKEKDQIINLICAGELR